MEFSDDFFAPTETEALIRNEDTYVAKHEEMRWFMPDAKMAHGRTQEMDLGLLDVAYLRQDFETCCRLAAELEASEKRKKKPNKAILCNLYDTSARSHLVSPYDSSEWVWIAVISMPHKLMVVQHLGRFDRAREMAAILVEQYSTDFTYWMLMGRIQQEMGLPRGKTSHVRLD